MDAVCEFCEKKFSRRFVLQRHLKNVHKVSVPLKKNLSCICPIENCFLKASTINEIRCHLIESHNFIFNEEEKTFENIDKFKEWKEEFENKVSFKKARGDEKYRMHIKQYFICNRSGSYNSQNKGKRVPVDTCKIGAVCPAYLNASVYNESNQVKVTIMNTHIGHTNELKFLRLPNSLKMEIAQKIKDGINVEKILESIRSGIESSYNRSYLLTKRDINNIQVSFGLKGIERHSDDATSVHLMYKEYSELPDNPFLICKLQGEEAPLSIINGVKEDDIFIVLMNSLQVTMMKKFGQHLICIDSTHGTNGYDFKLITVMVVNEFGEGFPVAWLISNHESESVLKSFFRIVKNKTGEIESEFFTFLRR